MLVTTSQYEISGKNHICSVKTFSSRAKSTRQRKKFIGTSSIDLVTVFDAIMTSR